MCSGEAVFLLSRLHWGQVVLGPGGRSSFANRRPGQVQWSPANGMCEGCARKPEDCWGKPGGSASPWSCCPARRSVLGEAALPEGDPLFPQSQGLAVPVQ